MIRRVMDQFGRIWYLVPTWDPLTRLILLIIGLFLGIFILSIYLAIEGFKELLQGNLPKALVYWILPGFVFLFPFASQWYDDYSETLPYGSRVIPTPASKPSENFRVHADLNWQNTGHYIQAGNTVEITFLSGQWTSLLTPDPYYDANGDPGYTCALVSHDYNCDEVIRNAPHGSLIARIANTKPIPIGNHQILTAKISGYLQLSPNFGFWKIPDREEQRVGSILVQITIGTEETQLQQQVTGAQQKQQEIPNTVTAPSEEFRVYADKNWQNTGHYLRTGDSVSIEYLSGTWTIWEGIILLSDGTGDPRGYICSQAMLASQCAEPIPDVAQGALIARIGTSEAKYIGNYGTFTTKTDGWLQLAPNFDPVASPEKRSSMSTGSILVRITIETSQ